MGNEIDFSKGGYGGDDIEEMFKPYTSQHMEYWWHFREILRPGLDKYNPYWKRIDGQPLSDDGYKELIALCLTNYAVYTSLSEALWFHLELKTHAPKKDLLTVRRSWKALYSSLYSSFNALCNIVCMVVFKETPFRRNRKGELWNYGPNETQAKALGNGIKSIHEPIDRCQKRLEIRNHLDHYWTIWHCFSKESFMIDRNYSKGYIALDPKQEVQCDLDAVQLADDDLLYCAEDFNAIYKVMALSGSYLDQYLSFRGWSIDYQDYGSPHNQKRPLP